MPTESTASQVKKNIDNIFARKKKAVYALCLYYSARALQIFREQQAGNQFWINRTNFAKDTMFTGAYQETDVVAWYMAHTMQYGIYLELANNRQNAAIRPIMTVLELKFQKDLAKIYSD